MLLVDTSINTRIQREVAVNYCIVGFIDEKWAQVLLDGDKKESNCSRTHILLLPPSSDERWDDPPTVQ